MERREKRLTDAYKAKKKKYKKRREAKKKENALNGQSKLQNLQQHFYSSPYPQKTAGDIEELETEKLAATRQWRRRRQRKILRKERELAAQACKESVGQYNSRLQEDETSKRGWMDENHQNHSLKMRSLDLNEMRNNWYFQRQHAELLRTRSEEMSKEDNKAAQTIGFLYIYTRIQKYN